MKCLLNRDSSIHTLAPTHTVYLDSGKKIAHKVQATGHITAMQLKETQSTKHYNSTCTFWKIKLQTAAVGNMLRISSTSIWICCPPSRYAKSSGGPLLFPCSGSSYTVQCVLANNQSVSIHSIRVSQTIFFQNVVHFIHLLFLLVDKGLLLSMVFNDVGQVVKAVINGSPLLIGRAVDRVFPSGSLGGLTNTLDTNGVLGHVVWSVMASSTGCSRAMMSTRREQHPLVAGGVSPKSQRQVKAFGSFGPLRSRLAIFLHVYHGSTGQNEQNGNIPSTWQSRGQKEMRWKLVPRRHPKKMRGQL